MPHPTPGQTDYIQTWLTQPKEGEPDGLREKINGALQEIYDPEIPINIYEVGLIWDYSVAADGQVVMDMTLTSPNCPAAEILPLEIETGVKRVEGVSGIKLEILWDPPYDINMMSEAAKLGLGLV